MLFFYSWKKSEFPKTPLVWIYSANANLSKLCFRQKYPCIILHQAWNCCPNFFFNELF